jgi:branched-chain amino acid transport system permease protein
MFIFILAAGLTLVLGVMDILNLAHGAFYLLGVYVAFSVVTATNNFLIGLLAAALALGIVGILIQRFLLSAVRGGHMQQMLVTYGLILIIGEGSLMLWGGWPFMVPKPAFLATSIHMGDFVFPAYRLLLIAAGVIIAALLWFLLEKTKWGAILRAGRDDAEMAEGIGLNTPLIWVLLFGLGALLGGIAGALGGPLMGAYPGADWEVLMPVFVVIVIGGMGSLKGAFVASIFLGLLDNIGRSLFPELAMFLIFLPMAIILVVKPTGLFGRKV